MYNFFKKHPDVVLVGFAILFLGILVGSFGWGIGNLIGNLNQAINVGAEAGADAATFDIKGATGLDLRRALK